MSDPDRDAELAATARRSIGSTARLLARLTSVRAMRRRSAR